jgi:hypothetical protein
MQLHNNAVHITALIFRNISKLWLMFVLPSNETTRRPFPEDLKLENVNWFPMFSLKINSGISIWNSFYFTVNSVSFCMCVFVCVCVFISPFPDIKYRKDIPFLCRNLVETAQITSNGAR